MNETQIIAGLLDEGAEEKAQKRAFQQASEYLEESYILNLPLSAGLRKALETFAARPSTPAALKGRARKLVRQYGR